jgi:glycosyltransferase involved in cell wall biosynthesis
MKTLLLIPAFNEAPTLPGLIQSARDYIPDILVIDDGSSDGTASVAEGAGAMVQRLSTNVGKGEAMKRGFEYAMGHAYDYVLTMDGDGQHAPADIQNFVPVLGQYDLILGMRMLSGPNVPPLRRTANMISTGIVSLVSGQRIYDSQTGFRAYRVGMLRHLELRSKRYDLESEVIIKAARKGFRVGHVPIQTIYAGEVSRFKNVIDSVRFLKVVFKSFFWR